MGTLTPNVWQLNYSRLQEEIGALHEKSQRLK